MRITKVISGGQTGADMGGLYAAQIVGLPTGGWAPKGWLTERGPEPKLLQAFGLKESHGSYPIRTKQNVDEADVTIIIAEKLDRGSLLTYDYAMKRRRSVFHFSSNTENIPTGMLKNVLNKDLKFASGITLNVAGNRESRAPGICVSTICLLERFLLEFNT